MSVIFFLKPGWLSGGQSHNQEFNSNKETLPAISVSPKQATPLGPSPCWKPHSVSGVCVRAVRLLRGLGYTGGPQDGSEISRCRRMMSGWGEMDGRGHRGHVPALETEDTQQTKLDLENQVICRRSKVILWLIIRHTHLPFIPHPWKELKSSEFPKWKARIKNRI